MEHLASAKMIFPFRLAALDVFGAERPVGEVVTCIAEIGLVGFQQVRSDIDIVDSDGRLWQRLLGWEDLRFELPAAFHALILSPRRAEVSAVWSKPVARVPPRYRVHCRRFASHPNSHQALWKRVWAQAILSRWERAQFRDLRATEGRQLIWLSGRSTAKEAIRHLVREQYGLDIPPADIEIRQIGLGRLRVAGSWRDRIPDDIVVTISQASGFVAALAGLVAKSSPTLAPGAANLRKGERNPGDVMDPVGLGFHVERIPARAAALPQAILSDAERQRLVDDSTIDDQEWLTRGWAAKEAVSIALGYDLTDGIRGIDVIDVDRESGIIRVTLAGHLARAYPALAATRLIVYTSRDDELVAATTLCEVEG